MNLASYAKSYSGGIINLNSGTLSADALYINGVGSVNHAGGHYAIGNLYLSNGGTIGYGTGDSITEGAKLTSGAALTLARDLTVSGGITVSDGASLTLDQNPILADTISVFSGGSIVRTSETISARGFQVLDATFDLLAGDTFSPSGGAEVTYGGVVNAPAGTSIGYLTVSRTNGNGDRATFNVNGDVTSVYAQANRGGIINLNSGTLSAQTLDLGGVLDGVGSLNQAGGHYATTSLNLANGATLGYGSGDSIASSVSIASGATLTLVKDLNVSGDIRVDGAATSLVSAGQVISAGSLSVHNSATVTLDQNLTLSGYLNLRNGGAIARTAEVISALAFDVNNATLDLLAGDTFGPPFSRTSLVQNGALVNAPAGTSIGYLNVSGTNGNGDRATFNVNGDVSLRYASASSAGVINLNSGTLSALEGLSLNGGSVTRSAGNYSTNSLTLSNGATAGYGSGDSVTSYVSLDSGAALTLDQNLTLPSYLYLSNGGSITRTSETISAQGFNVNNSTLDLLAGDAFSPGSSSYVQNGARVNTAAGTSLGNLEVDGTNDYGDRATFNVNGDVSLVNASAHNYGIINLNAGTLSASQGLSFDGVGSVARSAGSYSTNSLTLSNGATLGYGSGDSITNSVSLASGAALTLAKDLNLTGGITVDGAATSLVSAGQAISAGSLSVNNSATVTLDQNLTLSGYLDLQNGGAIVRTAGAISALAFNVNNATLDLLAGDTFSPDSSSYVQNGALVSAFGTALGSLIVSGTNGNGDRATFNVNGHTTLFSAGASSGGIINLNGGTLTAQSLSFDEVGSVTRSYGSYSTNSLTLGNGASLNYDYFAGDTINDSVSLASGAALTLATGLNLSGGITVDGAATSLVSAGQAISAGSLSVNNSATVTLDQNLTLSGYLILQNGGAIARTSEAISALAFSVDNATLDLLAGDTFSPFDNSYVQNGALVNAPAGTSLGYLYVTGTNGNGDRATFNVNGDTSMVSASAYSDGVINLIAGTLSTQFLSFDGAGSAGQSGGNYDVTHLVLGGGATLTFGLGDSIDSLSIMDAGSRLDELAPLTLTSLSLTNGGVLYLGAFTGTGAISNWGLRMTGDDTSFLQGLIGGGLLTAGFSPLSVIFDAGSNMTYVTFVSAAVPEIDPNTAHGAVVLLVGALGLLERRLRQAAIARHAA